MRIVAGGVGAFFIAVVIGAFIGTSIVNYDLNSLFGITAPWFIAFAIFLLTGGFSIPIALVLWLLHFISALHWPLFAR